MAVKARVRFFEICVVKIEQLKYGTLLTISTFEFKFLEFRTSCAERPVDCKDQFRGVKIYNKSTRRLSLWKNDANIAQR